MDSPPELDRAPSHARMVFRRLGCLGLGLIVAMVLVLGYVSQPFVKSNQRQIDAGDPDRLEADVRVLAGLHRGWTQPDGLEAAFAHVEKELARTPGRLQSQPFLVGNRSYRNLVASFGPPGPPHIVVGAHLDSFANLPGADDNASGVAVLLELARGFEQHPPTIPVELVVWTLEEPPHFRRNSMGSRHHARALRQRNVPLKLAISLECVGYFREGADSQNYPLPFLSWVYPNEGNYIVLVGKAGQAGLLRRSKAAFGGATALPVCSINAPLWVQGIDFSDHASYWDEGYPALMVSDTAFNRNRNYHRATDTPETLDYQRMALVVQGTRGILEAFYGEAIKAP